MLEAILPSLGNLPVFYTLLASLAFMLAVASVGLCCSLRGRTPRLFWWKLPVSVPFLVLTGVWASLGVYWLGFAAALSGAGLLLLFVPLPLLAFGLLLWGLLRWVRGKPYMDAVVIVSIVAFIGGLYGLQRAWLCEPLAHSGFGRAQLCTAILYEKGRGGVLRNMETARLWYEKAAARQIAEAEYWVGMRMAPGKEQKQRLLSAARQGYAPAAYRLFRLEGAESEDGLKWLRFAADAGHAAAMYRLGFLHRDGYGVQRDLERTRNLWHQAAAKGSPSAMRALALEYAITGIVYDHDAEASARFESLAIEAGKNEKLDELPADERWMAETWKTRLDDLRQRQAAVDDGDMTMLGRIGRQILSEAQDDPTLRAKGIAWLERAARAGDGGVRYEVANYYLSNASAFERDKKKGREWLVKAADGGHLQALRRVVQGHKEGRDGFDVDLYAAKRYSELLLAALRDRGVKANQGRWLSVTWDYEDTLKRIRRIEERYLPLDQLQTRAAEGDPVAQYHLAKELEWDRKEPSRVLELLTASARGGFAQAQFEMARRIRHRKRTEKEERQAIEWLEAAVRSGHHGAMVDLGQLYFNGLPRQRIERNYYRAKILFERAMAGRESVVYEQKTGMGRGWHVTVANVEKRLKRIPDFIMRLDLEGLDGSEKIDALARWHDRERGILVAKAMGAEGEEKKRIDEALAVLETQRALLQSGDDAATFPKGVPAGLPSR